MRLFLVEREFSSLYTYPRFAEVKQRNHESIAHGVDDVALIAQQNRFAGQCPDVLAGGDAERVRIQSVRPLNNLFEEFAYFS